MAANETRHSRGHQRPALIGVIHLPPLPGAPRAMLAMEQVVERAVNDALAYARGGASGVIVENFGDAPFYKERVPPYTVAAMALAVAAVRNAVRLPVGVNVLRNDAYAAMSIAAVTGASFIRVNVHTGAMLTDQGIVEGRADETVRVRRLLSAPVEIWADVLVKHAVPLGPLSLVDAARDTVERGLADALILTGSATGCPPAVEDVRTLHDALPQVPVYVGSGVDPERVAVYLPGASGFIVGTWAKEDGQIERPVSVRRVELLARAIERAASSLA